MTDPFNWKPDDVVHYLCDSSTEVTEDPQALAERIRTGRFNGKRLLTFGIVVSDRQLQEHLGLTEAWQQLELAEAIEELRRQSHGFQEWMAKRASVPPVKGKNEDLPVAVLAVPPTNGSQVDSTGPSLAKQTQEPVHIMNPAATVADSSLAQNDREGAASSPTVQAHHSTSKRPSVLGNTTADATVDENENRPTKRPRRGVLINITSETGKAPQPSFKTEEDHMSLETRARANVIDARLLESAGPSAYLGEGALRPDDIRSTSITLSSRIVDYPDGGFAVTLPNPQAPGLRLVVYRNTRRLLRETPYHVDLIAAGLELPSREGSIGLEDLPSEYDERTKREFSAEIRERELEQKGNLTPDEVTNLMDEAVNKVTVDWRENKQPKHERRAFQRWSAASRRKTRQLEIEEAERTIAQLELRLGKMRRDILANDWKRSQDVLRQCLSFEMTVEDICHQTWLISVLSSREPPPRPEQLPRLRRAARPREHLSDGEEILMSSDDENSFIVNDTEEASAQLRQDAEDVAARDQRGVSVMDLTVTPQKPGIIDLTDSPTGDRRVDSGSAIESTNIHEEHDFHLVTSDLVRQAKEIDLRNCARLRDRTGLLLNLLWKLNHNTRAQVFNKANETNTNSIWNDTIECYLARVEDLASAEDPEAFLGKLDPESLQLAFEVTRLFLMYRRSHYYPNSRLISAIKRRLSRPSDDPAAKNSFKAFLRILQQAAPHFLDDSLVYRREALLQESDEEFADDQPAETTPSRRRRDRVVEVLQDKNAVDLREREARRNAELQATRERFWKNMAASDSVPTDRTQHIINESKKDHQGLIYVNQEIGRRIKPHQIDGVRFLWNQIVQDAKDRQGCLLAHTMGLGKTMQVITFLVALHEAANSDDPTVREQVPQDLCDNPTLILCPAGLVENWMEELKNWAPLNTLNPLRKISSDMSLEERSFSVEQWAETGGVLVIGYEMLKQLFDMDDKIAVLLMETPTTVVADEAHRLKNVASKLHQVCAQFRTKARIALTGSPLANNVEEYYHMINWVAPNYLGPLQEFREIYSRDIEVGLYHDSTVGDKRQAIKMLQVLKETVAPKVNRATIAALKDDLPNKHEFVISMAPTPLQRDLYNACVHVIMNNAGNLRQSQIFAVLGILSLVCNHPKCLSVRVKDVNRDGAGIFSSALITTVLTMTRGIDIDDPTLSTKMKLLAKVLDSARAAGDKVLIFTTSIPTLQYLQYVLVQQKRKIAVLDGSTSINERQTNVKSFNEGVKEVYIISTRAGGVGLNIQGANRVVLFDFKWNPMDEQQAIGRAYRIGQEKTVYVYRFVVAGTFEEDLHNKAVFKTQLASRVVDKKNPISWSKRVNQLVHEVKETPTKDLSSFRGKDDVLDRVIDENKDAIKSIMSTDAFEEEDHTAALTADERRETDKLVHMNRLRMTDPAAYQRELDLQRTAEAVYSFSGQAAITLPTHRMAVHDHSAQTLAVSSLPTMAHSNGHQLPTHVAEASPAEDYSDLAHSMDGASDYPFVRSKTTGGVFGWSSTRGPPKLQYHASPDVNTEIPAPQPIAGANTYFGRKHSFLLSKSPGTPRPHGTTPFQTNISMAKIDFEQSFARHAIRLRGDVADHPHFNPVSIAAIVNEVDQLRKDRGLGFLPDDLQWKFLADHLQNPRFTAAAAFRRLTPQWLAFSSREDIQARLHTLDEMSEAEFGRFLLGGGISPDPTNLDNIRRPGFSTPGTPSSAHAQEDLKAMRAAADRRRTRKSGLPSWAYSALPAEN